MTGANNGRPQVTQATINNTHAYAFFDVVLRLPASVTHALMSACAASTGDRP